MSSSDSIFVGVDVGASRTKVVALSSGNILLGKAVLKSGTDLAASAESGLVIALKTAGRNRDDVARVIATGYGRRNVPFAHGHRTEISCHALGCYHYFPAEMSIIDIGGQDNKIIKIDRQGRRLSFRMNRKCAAGTGAFLEDFSTRLNIPLQQMNDLARQSTDMVELGSYCTVFSATEVLERIREGKKRADIVKGLFLSMIMRVLEMDSLTDCITLTGGVVAHNSYLVDMFEGIVGRNVQVPDIPQYTGALGAALFAVSDSKPGKD